MSNPYQNNLDDASDVVIIGESPGFNKPKQQPQASYQSSHQQYQNQNYQANNNSFQGNSNSFQGNNNSFQGNNNSFQGNSQNFQAQNYNPQNFQAVNNVTPQKNRGYSDSNISPSIQGQGYNQFTSPPRQQNYRAATPRFQSPGRGGHQQFNISPRQQSPRPLLTAQQLHEILNSPKGKRLTPQQRNYLIQQQALREKQLQQTSTPLKSVAAPRPTTPVAVRYQINNSPSYKAPLDRRPSQETPITDPFQNLPREPVTIDLIEPDTEPQTTSSSSMESTENANRNLMSTLDELNREKQEELNAVFAETNTNIETDTADETDKIDDTEVPSPANETSNEPTNESTIEPANEPNFPNSSLILAPPPSTESVVPKIMEEIMIAKQEKPDFDGENEDVLPKLGDEIDNTSEEHLQSAVDTIMDKAEKKNDAGVLSDASSSSANQDTAKKRGRPKKITTPFVDESDPAIRALIENGLDDPYSPDVDADDDEDYCPKPKKRRSKVHSKPLVRPQSIAETATAMCDSGIGTSVSSNDVVDEDQPFDLNVPTSDRQLRVKLTPVISTQKISESAITDKISSEGNAHNSEGEPLTKVKPLILRLHHQKFSEDGRFKTFKNLSASVRKAKLHAKRSKIKVVSGDDQDLKETDEVPVIDNQSNLDEKTEAIATKPVAKKRGRKKLQTKPVTVKRGRGRPKLNKAEEKLQNLKQRTTPPRQTKDSTTAPTVVSPPQGLVWPPKQAKNKNPKTNVQREPNTDENLSLPSKCSSRSSTPQTRSDISLPPPILPSELDSVAAILSSREDPPDISLPYYNQGQGPPASTSKLEDQSICPPVYNSRSRRTSECSSTRSSKKHGKKKTSGNGVAKEIEAVVSGLFGDNFMNMAESSGYTVNITFDVEKKPPLPSHSNGTQAKSEKSEDNMTKNLRERKQTLDKCDPNFFTNSELCSILQKRISSHPGIGPDLKAAYSDSIQHVQRLLDGNSK